MLSIEMFVARRAVSFVPFSCLFVVSFCVGRCSTFACHDSGIFLTAIYSHGNESVRGEVGFNTTFVLLARENGSLMIQYPWTDPNEFGTELNFTELQRDPLKNLSLVTNSSQVGVHYSCNLTTLNCTVWCTFGPGGTSLGDAVQGTGGFCVEGFALDSLKNSTNITDRWLELCDNLTAVLNKDLSPVYMDLTENNQTLFCELNTTVPVRYNVTVWGGGVNATTEPCRQNRNLTVICYVEVNVTGVENITDVLCTIRSRWWPERFTEYRIDDEYFEYYEDGEDIFQEARLGDEPRGDATTDPILGGGFVVIVTCVGMIVVSVWMTLRRWNVEGSEPLTVSRVGIFGESVRARRSRCSRIEG